jgi:hypothetical protein
MNQSDEKNWARQIVRSSLHEILAGKFQVPSNEEMETIIRDKFCEPFDDRDRQHPTMSDQQTLKITPF